MKKIFALCLCFLFIGIVNAEKCIINSGDGTNFGDVITCGTESFYILKYTDTETYLLAKYNLLVGDKIDYFEVDETAPQYDDYAYDYDFKVAAQEYCDNYSIQKGYKSYYVYPLFDDYYEKELKGCRFYERIEYEHIRQDERAKGTLLKDGKSVLPLYGITYMVPEWGYEAMTEGIIHSNVYDDNGDLILDNSSFEDYLNGYKEELERQGLIIKNVTFPNLDKIIEFMEESSGKKVEVDLITSPSASNILPNPEEYVAKMDIKSFIPEEYKWIYDITYWMGSGFYRTNQPGGGFISASEFNDYFISNEGFLCALGRGECGYFRYPIGNGIRPLVLVKNENIAFKIETKTDGHGQVKAEKNQARDGEIIKFTVIPDEGYEIKEVKATDSKGNVVKFNNYTFTMPKANVLIEATFSKKTENPNTKEIALSLLFIVLVLSTGIMIYTKKRLKEIV